jgi:Translation elongation factors (GTPases)
VIRLSVKSTSALWVKFSLRCWGA